MKKFGIEGKNLTIIAIFIIALLVGYYYFSDSQTEQEEEVDNYSFCTFPEISDEISCEEAVNISLARYPGIVKAIKISREHILNHPDIGGDEEKEVWIIYVNRTNADDVELKIDRDTGRVLETYLLGTPSK